MAKKLYKTMRGRPIDMLAIAAANADKQAIGNAKMNARGDILGPNGVVLRTQEQIEAEWRRNQQRQQEVAGISNQQDDICFDLGICIHQHLIGDPFISPSGIKAIGSG